MTATELLLALEAEHGPGIFNDLALAAFLKDTTEERAEGDDTTELVRDWCHGLCESLECCL